MHWRENNKRRRLFRSKTGDGHKHLESTKHGPHGDCAAYDMGILQPTNGTDCEI